MTVFAILAMAMALFVWNHWRYDVVAGVALMAAVYTGVVPVERAFEGFAHPAVITVAAVLVISQALQNSGVVELFLRYLAFARRYHTTQVAANCSLTALLSGFMNNIGALALMLPVTLRDARKAKRAASSLLMPLSFASLLGGLVTLIGTPPNIIIATFRTDHTGEPFGMFDFTPVGLTVALAGLAFLILVGWRLLPRRSEEHTDEAFELDKFITEIRLPEGSPLIGRTVGHLSARCENEIAVMAIVRNDRRRLAPTHAELLREGDVIILEGASDIIQPLFENPGLVEAGADSIDEAQLRSPDVRVIEAVVMPNSVIEGEAMREITLHQRFGVNLLAVSRNGRPARTRLKLIRFRTGDMLLLQGENAAVEEACLTLGCLGIKNRGTEITTRRGAVLTPVVFGLGILAAAFGLVPVQIAFTTVVGVLVLLRMVSLRLAYRSIEWPVIVLLGFLIPIGEALQNTGATQLIADGVVSIAPDMPLWLLLAMIIGISMLLADLVHNTPTAVLMAPIAYSLAQGLGYNADGFLMAVAIGAASPYLTPIGHQSNTLVMGPGGYEFRDYWRLGLPLDMLIIAVAVPMILWVWM